LRWRGRQAWSVALGERGSNVAAKLVYSEGEQLRCPSWEDTRRLISLLDGWKRTDLFIGDAGDNEYMGISGGNDGRYLIGVQEGKKAYYFLLNPARGEELVRINVGGLEDYYPANQSHDLDTVLQVARAYFDTGKRDPRFAWKKGNKETFGSP
jgi:Immunity protein Imm1